MGLPMDEVGIDICGDGKMLMSKVDISAHDLRGRDLYLYRCNACGTQNLLDYRGGELPCPCDASPGVTVTVLNQLTAEQRAAEIGVPA